MKKKTCSKMFAVLVVLAAVCSVASADVIMYGLTDSSTAKNGSVYGRDEFDPATVIPTSDVGVLGMGGVVCMTPLAGGTKYAVGMGHGYVGIKDGLDNTWNPTHNFHNKTGLNEPVLSIASRADGHVLFGTDKNEYMAAYCSADDLWLKPPGVSNASVNWMGSPVTAVATLPNGLSVVAFQNGAVGLRNADDLHTNVMIGGSPAPVIYWGTPVNDMAVDAAGNIVFALENGQIYSRNWADLNTNVGAGANYGAAMPVREVEMLSNGNVAIGFGNGYVDIRSATDLVNSLGLGGQFTGGTPITALEVTSNDNLIIAGYANGTVWTKSGLDMSTVAPVLVWGQEVNALAAIVPEPATMMLLGIGGLALLRRKK